MSAVSRQGSAPVLGCQQEAITLRLAAVSVLRYESSPGRRHLNHVITRRKSSSSISVPGDRFWRAVRLAASEVGPVAVTFMSLVTTPVTAKPAHCKGHSGSARAPQPSPQLPRRTSCLLLARPSQGQTPPLPQPMIAGLRNRLAHSVTLDHPAVWCELRNLEELLLSQLHQAGHKPGRHRSRSARSPASQLATLTLRIHANAEQRGMASI